jgi:hypothetical protein
MIVRENRDLAGMRMRPQEPPVLSGRSSDSGAPASLVECALLAAKCPH